MDRSPRKIIHVDMDAFYAAVEQRDRPELRGRPVIIGGSPRSRGVVCTASYEARRFGVRSAMSTAQAARLCPDGVFLPPDMGKYAAVSRHVQGIFRAYTDLVEPLSLDEAYLDVTDNHEKEPSATRLAEIVRQRIRAETGLTASAGVAPNKFLAKVASDMRKPDGLFVVPPAQIPEFVANLPVRKVPGVGPVTERRCLELGFHTCGDLQRAGEEDLIRHFGRTGRWFALVSRGEDPRPVVSDSVRKSVSAEDTFPVDLRGRPRLITELTRLSEVLAHRLARLQVSGRTTTVKVRFADFRLLSRSRTGVTPVARAEELLAEGEALLPPEVDSQPVRLLGIGVSSLLGLGAEEQLMIPFLDGDLPPP